MNYFRRALYFTPVALALVVWAVAAVFTPSGEVEAEETVMALSLLQQEADSARYAFAWGPAPGATHHELRINPGWDASWSIVNDLAAPAAADTTWVPLADTASTANVCVQGIARSGSRERRGPSVCADFSTPPALVTPGEPGPIEAEPVGDLVDRIEGIQIFPLSLEMAVGEEQIVRAFVYFDGFPTVCATFDSGAVGWARVEITDVETGDYAFAEPTYYLEDPDCGLEWTSLNPDVVTVEPAPPDQLDDPATLLRIAEE